jgi:hypothetical protein
MEKPLLVAALVCEPGDRLINLSSNIPRGMRSMDFVVSLRPFCVLHAVLHLTRLSRYRSAMLQWETCSGPSDADCGWSILRPTKPATNEMERSRAA